MSRKPRKKSIGQHPSRRLFVGRDRELREALGGLDDAVDGRGSLFLVAGEAGIGKSRLLEELAVRAERRARILRGACWDSEGAPPYWPWIQILRSYVRTCETDVLAKELSSGAAYVARVLPEVGARLELPPDDGDAAPIDAEQERFQLFDAVTAFLKNASRATPLVLVLDDLHMADRASLLLLQFLAPELRDSRLLVVAAYRDVEARRTVEVARILENVARSGQRLPLGGLNREEASLLIEATSGHAADDAVVSAIHRTTEGNPLFIDELTRLLLAQGRLDAARDASVLRVPQRIRDVIRGRMAPLSASSREILSMASVIGCEFDLLTLGKVAGIPSERVLDALGEPRALGMVDEVSAALGVHAFSHVLIRDTLYDDLRPRRRVELHRATGEAMEALYQTNLEPHLAELAHHFVRAAAGGAVEKSVDYSTRAGHQASRQLAHEEAASHYGRALEVLATAQVPDDGSRCGLLLELGEAQWAAGEFREAKATFWRAAGLAETLRSPTELARAALGFAGHEVMFENYEANENLVRLLEKALHALGTETTALRARVLARLAAQLTDPGDEARKVALGAQAVELARQAGDTAALARVLNAVHIAVSGPDNLEESLAMTSEVVRLADELGDRRLASSARGWRLVHLLELGDRRGADRELEALKQAARATREAYLQWQVTMREAAFALLDGRFEEVERPMNEALGLAAKSQEMGVHYHAMQLLFLRREQGRLGEVIEAFERLVREQPLQALWRCCLAWAYAEVGRAVDAERELERMAADRLSALSRYYFWLPCLWGLSETAASLGHRPHAAVLYETLLPYGRQSMVLVAAVCAGSFSRSLGLLAATLGRYGEAERHFEDALETNSRLAALPWVAHTQHEYARMLIARGGPDDARRASELRSAALETARNLGMTALIARLDALETPVKRPGHSPAGSAGTHRAVFRQEGEFWTISFEETTLRLKDTKGLRYIAELLRHPRGELLAVDLASEAPPGDRPREGDAGPLLDAKAASSYRHRLDELRADLEEARSFNDAGRANRAQEEIEFLTRELSRALGLGGAARPAASAAERARLNVTRAILSAIDRIASGHPSLGHHLRASIRTGNFCSYDPGPRAPVSWEI
ncbi:MAG: ATP-binding protein [Candidatus Binatia bacterium]